MPAQFYESRIIKPTQEDSFLDAAFENNSPPDQQKGNEAKNPSLLVITRQQQDDDYDMGVLKSLSSLSPTSTSASPSKPSNVHVHASPTRIKSFDTHQTETTAVIGNKSPQKKNRSIRTTTTKTKEGSLQIIITTNNNNTNTSNNKPTMNPNYSAKPKPKSNPNIQTSTYTNPLLGGLVLQQIQQPQTKIKKPRSSGSGSSVSISAIQVTNIGSFTDLKPNCTLIGINQTSIRGLQLKQVTKIIERIQPEQEIILLATKWFLVGGVVDDDENEQENEQERANENKKFNLRRPGSSRSTMHNTGGSGSSDGKPFNSSSISNREKKLLAETGCSYGPCVGCEWCGECFCIIQ
jgi:hypothetical protein